MYTRVVLPLLVCFLYQTSAVTRPSTMVFQNNQFTNVVVAIHDSIAEDKSLVDTLKERMTKASETLFTATRQRAYFKEVVILLPSTWSDDASYGTPSAETIYQADVVITDNFRKRRSVHTRSYSGCGQQGVHVLLNKDFLSIPRASPYYNTPAKYFVHAFAQFRWGVFQEYAEEGETPFYISLTSGRPESIRCVYNMRGLVQMINQTICYTNINPDTGLYADGCLWRPYPFRQRIKASMMDFQFIKEIETFCDDNSTNRETVHNYAAPNKHNRLCEHRSTWDVIQNTADFKGGINPPTNVSASDLTPTFRVVKAAARKRRAVIALPSITHKQEDTVTLLGRLKREADRHSVPLSLSYVKNDVIVEHAIALLGDINVLKELTSTNIQAPSCQQMLQLTNNNTSDAILVCNDETTGDHPGVVPHGQTVGHTVLDKLRHSMTDPTSRDTVIVIQRVDHTLMGGRIHTDTIHIDDSLKSNLHFVFQYQLSKPSVTIRSPSGRLLTLELAEVQDVLKEVVFVSHTETGEWTYTIKSRDDQTVSMVVTANTDTRDGIDIRLVLDKPELDTPYFRLFVDVTQFHHPIVGLNVTASIETPSRDQKWLQLLDNGAGADIVRDDGVYSRYFTDVREPGHYHVTVSVVGRDGHVYRKEENFEEMTSPLGFHDIQKQITRTMINGTLQRHVGGRSVYLGENDVTNQNGNDVIPPARITDLNVQQHVLYRDKYVLTFTAPGDDMDSNKVTSYEVYVGENIDSSSIPQFISYTKTSVFKGQGRITKKVYNADVIPMETEYILHDNDAPSSSESLVFGVVGVDAAGNKGIVSNIVITKNIAK